MGLAGYRTVIKLTGTATAMTSESMTTDGSAVLRRYKIDTSSKQIWNRSASFTFIDGGASTGSTLTSTQITTIDYLFGRATLSTAPTGAVTVTGQYLPASNVAGAYSYSLTQTREMLDDTDYTSTGHRSRKPGLFDTNITVSRWDSVDLTYYNDLIGASAVVVEVRPGGSTTDVGRGYFLVESENHSGDVGGLESADISLQLDATSLTNFTWNSI